MIEVKPAKSIDDAVDELRKMHKQMQTAGTHGDLSTNLRYEHGKLVLTTTTVAVRGKP